jgi:hypothetical protein
MVLLHEIELRMIEKGKEREKSSERESIGETRKEFALRNVRNESKMALEPPTE